MHADEIEVTEALVRHLLVSQLPGLSGRRLTRVEPWGTDNAIWRLGEDLVIRLPRIHWATGQVEREATWLPHLAPFLPVAVPEPIATGQPDDDYPFPWAVHRWLPGDAATLARMDDPVRFALELADVVRALHTVPTDGAPEAFNRAMPLLDYEESARGAILYAGDLIDARRALEVWEEAVAAPPHEGPRVWVHGDIEGNCLLTDGRLSGIVDWGSACAGDPAVDIQVVWSPLFTDESRQAFLGALGVDRGTLARSRGAAIYQACGALPYYLHTYPLIVERSWHKLAALGVGRRSGPRNSARGHGAYDARPVESVYEALGGDEGALRLAGAWHARVMADDVVSHAFSHGFHPEHTERLAAYWSEALGGPTRYSTLYGNETMVVRMHSGNGPHDEMDRRAIDCFDQALVDVGLAGDDRLRQVLHDYFEWATTTTMARYHRSEEDVPDGLRIPCWSWDGLVNGS